MQGFFYCLREGLRGFNQAKLSSVLSIFTFTISLLMICSFLFVSLNLQKVVRSIKDRLEVEIFIDNSYNEQQIERLKTRISAITGIEKITYISKAEASEILKKEFGEKIFSVLDENPLPASFRIQLKKQFQNTERAKLVIQNLQKISGIDEVVFRQDLLFLIDKYFKWMILILLGGGGLICLSALFFVYNTIRLIINSRSEIIETMKLVGATPGFIRRPFLIEGFLQGFLGTSFALVILYIVEKFLIGQFSYLSIISFRLKIILLISGMFVGFLGSALAIRKYLKY